MEYEKYDSEQDKMCKALASVPVTWFDREEDLLYYAPPGKQNESVDKKRYVMIHFALKVFFLHVKLCLPQSNLQVKTSRKKMLKK